MLTCIVGKNNINTFDFKDEKLREWSNKSMLKCPVCGEKMLYCHGDFKIPYFRHEKNSDCPDIYSEGVTEEHIQGIKLLYDWLQNQEDINDLQLEKWIPETRQRPDIYFKHNGEEYVIEYQCSPIATKYNERHDLYRLNNINDIWILGVNKYSIGEYNTLNNLNGNIELDSIKLKTIEVEVFNENRKVIYLNSNTNNIYIQKNTDMKSKTIISNSNYELFDINKLTINFEYNSIYYEFNMFLEKINEECEKLGKSYGYNNLKYNNCYEVHPDCIYIKVLKNNKVIGSFVYGDNTLYEILSKVETILKKMRERDNLIKLISFKCDELCKSYGYDKCYKNKIISKYFKYNNNLNTYDNNIVQEILYELEDKLKEQKKAENEKILINDYMDRLNNIYKNVNNNCEFELTNWDSEHYKYCIEFTSDILNLTFYIKDNTVDMTELYSYTKPFRGKRGGIGWKRYNGHRKLDSYNYEYINKDTFDKIYEWVSTSLRNIIYKQHNL